MKILVEYPSFECVSRLNIFLSKSLTRKSNFGFICEIKRQIIFFHPIAFLKLDNCFDILVNDKLTLR